MDKILLNRKEIQDWMEGVMHRGFSFRYIKGIVEIGEGVAEWRNTHIKCIESGEILQLIWKKQETKH